MLLSDRDIATAIEAGQIGVDPFDPSAMQPASVDVTLHELIRVPRVGMGHEVIDVASVEPDHTYVEEIGPHGYTLAPGQFVLGSTQERLRLDVRHAARAEGISSLGRLGLAVHVTAGWIDPGFEGQVTLEIVNHAPWSLVLRPGMRIAQFAFFCMSTPALWPYYVKGSYQRQEGPTESRYRWKR